MVVVRDLFDEHPKHECIPVSWGPITIACTSASVKHKRQAGGEEGEEGGERGKELTYAREMNASLTTVIDMSHQTKWAITRREKNKNKNAYYL